MPGPDYCRWFMQTIAMVKQMNVSSKRVMEQVVMPLSVSMNNDTAAARKPQTWAIIEANNVNKQNTDIYRFTERS